MYHSYNGIKCGGGSEPETISSIKLNAPLDYATQGRAVTQRITKYM